MDVDAKEKTYQLCRELEDLVSARESKAVEPSDGEKVRQIGYMQPHQGRIVARAAYWTTKEKRVRGKFFYGFLVF